MLTSTSDMEQCIRVHHNLATKLLKLTKFSSIHFKIRCMHSRATSRGILSYTKVGPTEVVTTTLMAHAWLPAQGALRGLQGRQRGSSWQAGQLRLVVGAAHG